LQRVADAAHRLDNLRLAQLPPQVADVHLEDVRSDVLTAPDVFEDAESIVNDPRLAQEELEEVELLRGQFDSGGPASHLPRSGIELHIGESQKLARLARRAAHQRSNPREQLLDRERFDEV